MATVTGWSHIIGWSATVIFPTPDYSAGKTSGYYPTLLLVMNSNMSSASSLFLFSIQ